MSDFPNFGVASLVVDEDDWFIEMKGPVGTEIFGPMAKDEAAARWSEIVAVVRQSKH